MEQQRLAQDDERFEVPRVNLRTANGFEGKVENGLKVHPNRQHLVYPLGCALVIQNIDTQKEELLWGHTDAVTCVAISHGGELLASGQKTHPGFKADVIVWDYATKSKKYTLNLHKVKVQALAFSPSDLYLASLGACDDGSVIIWNMETGEPICGAPAQVESAGNTLCINFSKFDDNIFVTGGESTLRVWTLDVANRKIRPEEVDMGQIKRKIFCIEMHAQDPEFFFCGTETGDILAINLKSRRFQYKAPEKGGNFHSGVTALAHLKNANFLVGTGCGDVCELKFPLPSQGCKKQPKSREVRKWRDDSVRCNNESSITSIALRGNGSQFFVGSKNARVYKFEYADCPDRPESFSCKLAKTCHSCEVTDIVFPKNNSDLIVTSQHEQVRIWALNSMQELKRFIIHNQTCNAVVCTSDGKYILTAWQDGYIRILAFKKQAAKKGAKKCEEEFVLQKAIEHAHQKGVTAIACTKTSIDGTFKAITGGGEGEVRIWMFRGGDEVYHELKATLKEHKGSISDIKVVRNDRYCVSSSCDGSCIIWDLESYKRTQVVFANTLFKCVSFNNEETQIITSGSDRMVTYWEVHNGTQIRELPGAKSGSVNALDAAFDNSTGKEYIVTGGDDKLLKVWSYDSGEVKFVGTGHSAAIKRVRISPCMRYIVSVGADGAILTWDFPSS